MSVLVGGVAALILGIILLIVWWGPFLTVLAGAIPLLLLLGGALAAYLGYEEMKDRRQIESELTETPVASAPPPAQEELERYKQETEKYKREVDELKEKLKSEGQSEQS